VTLKNTDVAKALTEYANYAAIEKLVLGASKSGLIRYFLKSHTEINRSNGVCIN